MSAYATATASASATAITTKTEKPLSSLFHFRCRLSSTAQEMSLLGAGSGYAVLCMIDWFDDEVEAYGGIGGTTIRKVNNLRGLYATRSYEPGQRILTFPTSVCLTLHERIEFKPNGSHEKCDEDMPGIREGGVALRKLLMDNAKESATTSDSFWKTYLDSLPTESDQFDATPDFWDEDLIRQLEVPQIVEQMLERREQTKPQDDETPSLAFATWLVSSRAFTFGRVLGKALRNGDGKTVPEVLMETRTVLIPYLDMLNHAPAGKTNSALVSIEKTAAVRDSIGDDNERYFALVATKPIAAGDELTLSYGPGLTSLDLFAKYGFWLCNNPDDLLLDLSRAKWSTSLLEDKEELALLLGNGGVSDIDRRQRDRRALLEFRIHLKTIQQYGLLCGRGIPSTTNKYKAASSDL